VERFDKIMESVDNAKRLALEQSRKQFEMHDSQLRTLFMNLERKLSDEKRDLLTYASNFQSKVETSNNTKGIRKFDGQTIRLFANQNLIFNEILMLRKFGIFSVSCGADGSEADKTEAGGLDSVDQAPPISTAAVDADERVTPSGNREQSAGWILRVLNRSI
jgi:hypothetical protein